KRLDMKPQPLDIVKKIWEHYSPQEAATKNEKPDITQALAHKLLHFFQAGDFYIYVFNVSAIQLEYVSPGVEKVLGYRPDELTIESLFENMLTYTSIRQC